VKECSSTACSDGAGSGTRSSDVAGKLVIADGPWSRRVLLSYLLAASSVVSNVPSHIRLPFQSRVLAMYLTRHRLSTPLYLGSTGVPAAATFLLPPPATLPMGAVALQHGRCSSMRISMMNLRGPTAASATPPASASSLEENMERVSAATSMGFGGGMVETGDPTTG
jgi:hypothetical protein